MRVDEARGVAPLDFESDSASLSSWTFHSALDIRKEGDWFVAFCPEVPEANGQGRTQEECLQSLRDAVPLLMEDRREDARRKSDTGLLELA